MTNHQKYKKALIAFNKDRTSKRGRPLCYCLSDVIGEYPFMEDYPELLLFKREGKDIWWFDDLNADESKSIRKTVLELCIAMTF